MASHLLVRLSWVVNWGRRCSISLSQYGHARGLPMPRWSSAISDIDPARVRYRVSVTWLFGFQRQVPLASHDYHRGV